MQRNTTFKILLVGSLINLYGGTVFASEDFSRRMELPSTVTNSDFLQLAKTLIPGSSFDKICKQKFKCSYDKKYENYKVPKNGFTEISLYFTPDNKLYRASITVASHKSVKLQFSSLKKSLINLQLNRGKRHAIDYKWRGNYENGNENEFDKTYDYLTPTVIYAERNYISEIQTLSLSAKENYDNKPLYRFDWSFDDFGDVLNDTYKRITSGPKIKIPIDYTSLFLDKSTLRDLHNQTKLQCKAPRPDTSGWTNYDCYINNEKLVGVTVDEKGILRSFFTYYDDKLSSIQTIWQSANPDLRSSISNKDWRLGPLMCLSGLYGNVSALTWTFNTKTLEPMTYRTTVDGNVIDRERAKTLRTFNIVKKKEAWFKRKNRVN